MRKWTEADEEALAEVIAPHIAPMRAILDTLTPHEALALLGIMTSVIVGDLPPAKGWAAARAFADTLLRDVPTAEPTARWRGTRRRGAP